MQEKHIQNVQQAHLQDQFLIVTGYSGAGKSTVLRALEDIGFFCVDNLPVPMLNSFFSLAKQHVLEKKKLALGIDIRGGHTIQETIIQLNKDLEQYQLPATLFFLTAHHEVLIKRFQETRRTHPLAKNMSLKDALVKEYDLLKPLIEWCDIVLDTSQLSVHDLRNFVRASFSGVQKPILLANLISFGFKFGVPIESNYIFDLRSLPNPYFIPELKSFDGTHDEIQSYLFSQNHVQEYWNKLIDFIEFALKKSYEEGRYCASIALGCTGGRHRSVAFVHRLSKKTFPHVQCLVYHRDSQRSERKENHEKV